MVTQASKHFIFILTIFCSCFLTAQVVVYESNFDSSDDGWTNYEVLKDNEKWNWTTTSFAGSDGGHWATSPYNDYINDMLIYAESPEFDFSGESDMTFSTSIRYQTANNNIWGDDGCIIQYTTDGTNWTSLGRRNSGTNWYNNRDVDAIANNEDGWSGNNGGWETASIDLPAAVENKSNVKFRFLFASNWISHANGVAFDDIEISNTTGTIYFEDFNTNDGGWSDVIREAPGSWLRSNNSFTGNTTNHWHLTPHNNYADLVNAGLTSQEYDFRAFEDLTLQFDLRYDIEENWDGLIIEYTTDSINWTQLGDVSPDWYSNANAASFNEPINGAWNGDNGTWETMSYQLPDILDYAPSIYFRFRFLSDSYATNDDGAAIDNVLISVPTTTTTNITQTSGDIIDANIWFTGIPNTGSLAFVDTNHVITLSANTSIDFDLSFLFGSTLDLNGYTLTSTGDLNFDITASIIANKGRLVFAKNGDQTIGNAAFYDLELSGSGTKTANVPLSVSNDLLIENGNITVESNGNITLKSSSDGTGRLLEIPSGATVNGEMTVERYIGANKRTWWQLASPFSDASISDWQNNFPITGEFSGSSILDGNNNTSLYYYDETDLDIDKNVGWIDYPIATNTENIESGKGYRVFLRNNSTTFLGDTVFSVSGNITTGDVVLPVTYSPTGLGDDTDAVGWSFVGNPYPCDIDWDATGWTKTNINDAIYVWDALNRRYTTYIGGVEVNGGSQYIASSQGFWVRTNASNPQLESSESVKSSNNTIFYRREAPSNLLYIEAIEEDKTSNTAIRFNANATTEFDGQLDAEYLGGGDINLCTYKADQSAWYAVNSLPDDKNLIIPIWVIHNEEQTTRSLKFTNLGSFDDEASLQLIDAYKKDTILITDNLNYEYTYNGNYETNGAERFSVIRTSLLTSINEEADIFNKTNVFPTKSQIGQNLNISTEYRGEITISIIDLLGREVYKNTLFVNNLVTFNPNLTKGIFNVILTMDGVSKTEKVIVTE